ncbi:MAG: hypothetical protein QM731_11420 [Chitinophagaceae bacterium]
MALLLYKWSCFLSIFLSWGEFHPAPAKSLAHPLYISVTEMNHNAKDKTLEISCKIFTDDFEKTLTGQYHQKIDFFNPQNKAEIDKEITDYIKKRLVINLDGKPVILEYVGFEHENDAVWSYFQVSNVAAVPKKVTINNSLLYEVYEKQINLMHVTVGGNRKSTRLNNPDKDVTLEF